MAARLYRVLFLLLLCLSGTYCKKKVPQPPPEEVIEEIDGKKLAELLETEEYLAVFFYTKSCKDCDKILHELERIDDEADQFGVAFVKICERSTAKKFGITTFPQLVYFRNQQPTFYDGDMMNEEQVLDWLTNLEAMELPDKIEEVNAKILQNIIDETDYVAVLFYKQKCKECDLVLHELEEIDDEADQNGIAFVKIIDEALSTEYGLEELPALVYYRKKIPLLYDGDLMNEQDVLSWLNEFKDIGEEGDVIEDVSASRLVSLIDESDFLAVLFYDKDGKESDKVLEELENIDDDAERNAIDFVKIDDDRVAHNYGIEELPALVYFEKGVPNFYEGDLTSEEDVLDWLVNQKNTDEIEDVSDEALDILIKKNSHVAVLYYSKEDKKSQQVLEELESIDDDTDKNGILFVKTDDDEFAKEYDVDQLPQLIFFENQAPTVYKDDLTKEEKVLEWLVAQKSSDEIEDVTPKILEQMIEENENLAVLFYDNDNIENRKTLGELENIDDDTDKHGIPFVKIDDDKLALSYGVDELPAMVYFEKGIPNFYQGDLKNEDEVLKWLIHQKNSDEIEDVSDKVLEKIIKRTPHVIALFYDREDKESQKVLSELENIDDDTDKLGVQFVKIDDDDMAKEYGIEELPQIIFFEHQVPILYEGDPKNEDALLKWVVEQMESDEIEDVSEKVLEQLIEDSDYLAVLFYDSDNPKSKQIIKELENIDDETDHAGIPFIKIDSDEVAKEFGIDDELPLLVYFENSIPSVYNGDLKNEENVLEWLLHQKQSDEIEDVTDKMLEMLIESQEHLVVLFYDKSKGSEKILRELENIDDEADQNGMAFVKTDDVESATKYGIEKFPTLVLFENEIPNLYDGDLLKEEDVLRWLLDQKEKDEIEDITENMLKNLVENTHALAVLFYDKDNEKSAAVLKELENIDDDTDKRGIPFVKIDDDSIAKDFGVDDEIPVLVYFEDQIPSVYEGDLRNEDEVLKWLIHQKEHDTIEEVTDEILENLIKEREYVLVFFAPDSCSNCDKILAELEHIDDDTDDHGINFVTTDDMNFAKKKAGVTEFPALVLFRNEEPVSYQGDWSKQELKDWLIPSAFRSSSDLIDEDAVLKWVTKEETLDDPDEIDEVNSRMLQKMLDTNHFVAVLFYQEKNPECKKVLHELENIDDDAELSNIDFVKVSDPAVAREYDIRTFPSLVFFRHKFPQFYEGDLKDEEEVLAWLNEKKSAGGDVIEQVDKKMLKMLLEDAESVTVFFYDDDCQDCDTILAELEHIDDDTDKLGIHFVKTDDIDFAKKLDITEFPSLVYFENEQPSLYFGDLMDEESILTWLTKQKTEDTIENINRDMLNRMIAEKDYLAVFFYVPGDLECDEIIEHLEQIDDDCTDYEVTLVKMSDNLMAKKYGIRKPPGIVFFRHGKHIKYPGDLFDEEEVLEWLTNPENMELSDAIERVNKRMFERILPRYEYIAVLFYGKNCKQCPKVLEELEKIDDEADAAGIHFVKMDDDVMAKKFGCFALPALVFFPKGERDVPIIYAGDLRNGERILGWLLTQKDPSSDHIEDVDGETLRGLIKKSEYLTVYFYDEQKCGKCDDESKKDDPDCEECTAVLEELENIDDDTDRHGIQFVKTSDHTVAEVYGIKDFPALLYFERRIPSVYEGDLLAEEEVLQWLVHQRSEDTIETVNRNMLEKLVEDTHYLAVYFYKQHCKACDASLAELENIDDDLDLYGIQMVKIQDNILAKRYGIKTYPALVYFRNGNPLLYDGDIRNEEMVLEWLIDDENRELADEIESINSRMLNKLVEESPFLAVFFYDETAEESIKALKDLENIDDEADVFGIDFVKISDPEAAMKWNVMNLPTLAYFRKQTPVFFDGELSEEEKVLQWLTSQDVFEIKDEIEEVNRKMLDKLLEENEFVAVYFYDNNCPKCELVLEELEHIDDEADDLDIMFVKIKDVRYSKKYGISQVPALVYFRRKFPSIYRGDLETEEEVLEWLRKNRYRHPELNLFMYILVAISLAFVFYTLFLMFCFNKNKEKTQ